MRGRLTLEALEAAVAEGSLDTVVVAMPDMQGRLVGKRLQAEFFLASGHRGTHACSDLLATDLEMAAVPGFAPPPGVGHSGDYLLRPDLSTLRRIPWLEGTALVLADALLPGGEPVAHAPRTILRQQVERLAERGFVALVAPELEFYSFEQSYAEALAAGYRGLAPVSPYIADYHIFQTTREEGLMRAIRTGLHAAGIPIESSRGEGGAGQGELNIRYDDAVPTADAQVIAKNGAKEIAWAKGRSLSFLARPGVAGPGSSCHLHLSLRTTDGRPAFVDAGSREAFSPILRAWLAGLVAHAAELTLFLAPNINSYKRMTGADLAPTRATWSVDDRTAAFRIVGVDTEALRVECRIGGSDLNPYLAIAALIAAGLAGLEQGLDLLPGATGGDGGPLPRSLRDATALCEGSAMLRQAFGSEVLEHYVHAARWEQDEYDRAVTDWEIARGFERS